MSKWTWGGSVLILLVSIGLSPAALQDTGPCDPIKIDLTTLVPPPPPPPPPPGPECASTVKVIATTTGPDGQPMTVTRILSLTQELGTLAIIDPGTSETLGTLALGVGPIDCMTASKDASIVFITAGGILYSFQPAIQNGNFVLVQTSATPVGGVVRAVEPIPTTTLAASISKDSNLVRIADTATGTVTGTVVLSGDPTAIKALTDGTQLVVTLNNGTVALVNLATMSVIAYKSVGADPSGVAICEPSTPAAPPATSAEKILVTDRSTGTVTVMDASTFTVTDVVSTSASAPSRIISEQTGTPTVDLALLVDERTVHVLDCNQTSPTFLKEFVQIRLDGPASSVVMGLPGTGVGTFIDLETHTSLVAIDSNCLTPPHAPQITSVVPASGVPGTRMILTGSFPAGTKFITSVQGIPVDYVSPVSISPTVATVDLTLGLAPGITAEISATLSSEAAVLTVGNYLQSTPKPFHTLDVLSAIDALIAQLQAVIAAGGLSNQAKKAIEKAIDQLQKAKIELGKGHIAEAMNHFSAALGHMQTAITKGANLGTALRRLGEIAQFLVFQKLNALTNFLGAGSPLLANAQLQFNAGQGSLAVGNFSAALGFFSDSFGAMANAIAAAHPLTKDETLTIVHKGIDATYDAVEQLRLFQKSGIPTLAQSADIDKAIKFFGPKPGGIFTGSALEAFAASDVKGGVARVKQGVHLLDDLVHVGVPIEGMTKDLVKAMVKGVAEGCADAEEKHVGPFDPHVVFIRKKVAEAEPLFDPHFTEAMLLALQAVGDCVFFNIGTCSVAIVAAPVPDLFEGTSCSTAGEPFKVKYLLLVDPPNTPAYVRITVRDGNGTVLAVVSEGVKTEGQYSQGWNGVGIASTPEPGTDPSDPPVLPPGTYTMHYEAWCLLGGVAGTPATGDQTFKIVAVPNGVFIKPTSLEFKSPQAGLNPPAETVVFSVPNGGSWVAEETCSWLTLSAMSGSIVGCGAQELHVSVSNLGLDASDNPYTCLIVITSSSPNGSSVQFVSVSFFVTPPGPTFLFSTNDLTFVGPVGGPNPIPQKFDLTNSGSAETKLNWTATTTQPWLSIAPLGGSLFGGHSQSPTVSVNTQGLTVAGSPYTGFITLSDPDTDGPNGPDVAAVNNPQYIQVTLIVIPTGPELQLQNTVLSFEAVLGEPDPDPQTFKIKNKGPAGTVLVWTAFEDTSWLNRKEIEGLLASQESENVFVSVHYSGLQPGIHTATITVSSPATFNSPQLVHVTFKVTRPPAVFGPSPSSLSFRATKNGMNPLAQNVQIVNQGPLGSVLAWKATDLQTWLDEGPSLGFINGLGAFGPSSESMSVGVNITGLPQGTHYDSITIESVSSDFNPPALNPPGPIAVDLIVDPPGPTIRLSKSALSFFAPLGEPAPVPQAMTITNSGGPTTHLHWKADVSPPVAFWLHASPASADPAGLVGFTSQPLTISVDSASLSLGTHVGTITIADTQSPDVVSSPQTITVTLTITPSQSMIDLSTLTLNFEAAQGGFSPLPQTVTLTNGATVPSFLNWSQTDNQDWLSVQPPSGLLASGDSQPLTVSINTAGLTENTYFGVVKVEGNNLNGPQHVHVVLHVFEAGPMVQLVPGEMSLTAQQGQTVPVTQNLTITNIGPGGTTLNWLAADAPDEPWISVSPPSGSLASGQSQPLTVTVNVGSLSSDQSPFGAVIAVSGNGVNGTKNASVSLMVTPAPHLTALYSPTGIPAGGNGVIVFGSSLTEPAQVLFGPSNPATILSITETYIQVVAPPAPNGIGGPVNVTVTLANGSASNSLVYIYALPPIDQGPSFVKAFEIQINQTAIDSDDLVGLRRPPLPDGFQAPLIPCRIRHINPTTQQPDSTIPGDNDVLLQNVSGGGDVGFSLTADIPPFGLLFTGLLLEKVKNNGEWRTFYIGGIPSFQTTETVAVAGFIQSSIQKGDAVFYTESHGFGGRQDATVIDADLDIDSNNDLKIDNADDPIEHNSPGRIVCINDDDDGHDTYRDNSDGVITLFDEQNGDKLDMTEFIIRRLPALTETGFSSMVLDGGLLSSHYRVFNQDDVAQIGPAPNPGASSYQDFNIVELSKKDFVFRIEGIESFAGSSPGQLTLTLSYKNGDGLTIARDIIVFTIVRVHLDADTNNDLGGGTASSIQEDLREGDEDKPGLVVCVNDDDDDMDGAADWKDEVVNGPTDESKLEHLFLEKFLPASLTGGELTLTVSDPAVVRVFDHANKAVVGPSIVPGGGPVGKSQDYLESVQIKDRVWVLEGVAPGVANLTLTYKRGSVECSDTIRVTVVSLDIRHPRDDNGNGQSDEAQSEFTYSTASPGMLSIPAQVRIQPDSPVTQAYLKDHLAVFVGAIADSHTNGNTVKLNWDHPFGGASSVVGRGVYNAATALWEAEASFKGMPVNNNAFGKKELSAKLFVKSLPTGEPTFGVFCEKKTGYEVFYPLFVAPQTPAQRMTDGVDGSMVRNRPGGDLNALPADNNGIGPSPRAPNWFFYWSQEIQTTELALYVGSDYPSLVFGATPAGTYSDTYTGFTGRILISEFGQGKDIVPVGTLVTGIDTFRDTVVHENYHVYEQLVRFTNEGFHLNISVATLHTASHWSGASGGGVLIPPGAAGYNHYFDINHDGDTSDAFDLNGDGDTLDRVLEADIVAAAGGPHDVNGDGDLNDLIYEREDLDANGNGVPDWHDTGIANQIEADAEAAEPNAQDAKAAVDWGDPGKNHRTIKFND